MTNQESILLKFPTFDVVNFLHPLQYLEQISYCCAHPPLPFLTIRPSRHHQERAAPLERRPLSSVSRSQRALPVALLRGKTPTATYQENCRSRQAGRQNKASHHNDSDSATFPVLFRRSRQLAHYLLLGGHAGLLPTGGGTRMAPSSPKG